MSHNAARILFAINTIRAMNLADAHAALEKLLVTAPTATLRVCGVDVPVVRRNENDPHSKVADTNPQTFRVVIHDVSNNKIQLIKLFREETGARLAEAKDWCEGKFYSGPKYRLNPGEFRNEFKTFEEAQKYAENLERRAVGVFTTEVQDISETYKYVCPWIQADGTVGWR
jgi:ribosomal protein L7/L12